MLMGESEGEHLADELPREGRRSLGRQVDLMGAALRALADRRGIDSDHTAVLAWSYGGESATLFQRRRDEVRLVLGIDATIVSSWIFQGEESLAEADGGLFSAPYALLRNGRPRIDVEPSSEPPLLAEFAGGAWFVRFPRLSHGNFNFPGGMLPGILGLEEVSPWAVGGDDARIGYEAICRVALGLLDHALRGSRLEPSGWSSGAPDGFIEVTHHRGVGFTP